MRSQQDKSVIHVGCFLSSRGVNRQMIEELADRLEQNGWNVIRTSNTLSRPMRVINMIWDVWRWRRQYQVGHIAVFSGWAFLWAEAAAMMMRLTGTPYVLSLHGGNLPAFAKRWPGRVRRLLGTATAVVTPSRYLLEELKIYKTDMGLLPNPLQIKHYSYRLRINASPNLLWLRAFHEIYNPSLAPVVVKRLIEKFPAIRLTMVGPDKGDGSLQKTQEVARNLGVEDRICFMKGVPKNDVPDILNKGDIFLNTTQIDNTPISVLEALACGLCVVSTNVGGIPYLLENETDSLLVPPNDSEAMATAVERLLTDSELAQRLSSLGRQKVEEFDWNIILPQWESILSSVAARRKQ